MTKLTKEQRFLVFNRVLDLMAKDLNEHLMKAFRKAADQGIKEWDNKAFHWFLLAESAACEEFAKEVNQQNKGLDE